MKKLLLLTTVSIFVLSASTFTGAPTLKPHTKKENMKISLDATTATQNIIPFPQKLTVKAHPQYNELESKYEGLTKKELNREIKKLDKQVERKKLIELANNQELTDDQKSDLLIYMKNKAVLTMLLMDLEVEEL